MIYATVKTLSGFLKKIDEIIKLNNKKNKFLFRGQENKDWNVETSACRRSKEKEKSKPMSEEHEVYYNIRLIEQYKHADYHSNNSSEISKQDLGILAQLQHNGAATSLIDFSYNPLVALWFACEKSSKEDSKHGKVFILDITNEKKFEEIDSFEQIQDSKVSAPEQAENPKVYGILNNPKFFYWKPAHLNNRITAQQSYFLIGKRELPKMKGILILKSYKSSILKELSSTYGINETTLFPDLVGFAQANSVRSLYNQEEQDETKKFIAKKDLRRTNKEIISQKNLHPINKKTISQKRFLLINKKIISQKNLRRTNKKLIKND